MTASRRARKRAIWAILALAAGLLVTAAVPHAPRAATTERVVTDRHTGLALYGVDPVGYFTERKPVLGNGEFEHRHAGAIWRFQNEGNRAAFAADPHVYMPRFGGYDPVSVARGVSNPGYPQLWLVVENRLYLFYTAQARAAFIADPAATVAAAEARWAQVMHDLAE